MGKIYKNDIGTEIVLDTGNSLVDASLIQIKVMKPGASSAVTWAAAVRGRPCDGKITYTTVTGDLGVIGTYKIQAYVEWGSKNTYLGETVNLEVHDHYR